MKNERIHAYLWASGLFGISYCDIRCGFPTTRSRYLGVAVGVGIYLLIRFFVLGLGQLPFFLIELVVILVIIFAGIWAASQTERITGRKDPGKVVVDEVAGQLIALLPVAMVSLSSSWKLWVIVSFILFRFFDIVKPYPARQMECLHGGLGIMCDDLNCRCLCSAYGVWRCFLNVNYLRGEQWRVGTRYKP